MNELVSVGMILLLALLAGHVVKVLRIPEVTGYLLAGVALGPSLLGWISDSNLQALGILSDVALGLILFSIGTVFELQQFRRIGRKLAMITVCEASLTAVMVGGALLAAGQPAKVSVVLAVMAIETAAASTLMVIRECNASGPVTEFLTGLFALDNLLCLFLFNIAITAIELGTAKPVAGTVEQGAFEQIILAALGLAWQFLGAMALGYVIGFLLSAWSLRVVEHGEQLILLAGCVLLCVGLAKWLEVSSLVANLTIGATVVNLSGRSRKLVESLSQTDPPLYAIFFVLAGADLDITKMRAVGIAGVLYVVARSVGKWSGTALGTRWVRAEAGQRAWLPSSMLAQAGLAVGLTFTLRQTLPEIAGAVTNVILSAVIVFEMIGPAAARWSIVKSGESQADVEPAGQLLT